jgi:hypothetical protein
MRGGRRDKPNLAQCYRNKKARFFMVRVTRVYLVLDAENHERNEVVGA